MEKHELIISHLSDDEISMVRNRIIRFGKNTLPVKLFDLLTNDRELSAAEIEAKLYPKGIDRNNYKGVRQRLTRWITNAIVHEEMESDDTAFSQVTFNISIARWLLRKKLPDVSNGYIDKAISLAVAGHHYDLLDIIYNLQLLHADELEIDLLVMNKRLEENAMRHQQLRRLNAAFAKIKVQLKAMKPEGDTFDPKPTILSILSEFDVSGIASDDPAFTHRLARLCRTIIATSKHYREFRPHLKRMYERLKSVNAFAMVNKEIEIDFIYMIAHAQYRTREFKEALELLDKMKELIPEKKFTSHALYGKYIALRAAIACYQGFNEEAIETLREKLEDENLHLSEKDKLDMQLNLTVYYFLAREFKLSNGRMINIPHKPKWLNEKAGKEWMFKKEMIEMLIYYEIGHIDIARTKLQKIKKNYADLLKKKLFLQANRFLGFVETYFDNPQLVRTKEFAMKVKAAKLDWRGAADLHAIIFFCWLKGKMMNKDCYELMIERMAA